ncbi:unnamed protein product [Rhodiola kirilowii]
MAFGAKNTTKATRTRDPQAGRAQRMARPSFDTGGLNSRSETTML